MVYDTGFTRYLFQLTLGTQEPRIFAFKWTNLLFRVNEQLSWIYVPQALKYLSTILDKAFPEDLNEYRTQNHDLTLLQYVNCFLMAASSKLS